MKYDSIIIGWFVWPCGGHTHGFSTKSSDCRKAYRAWRTQFLYARKHRTFDVGLHAMTNYSPPGDRRSPLGKLLKQLRFRHEEFRLRQQEMSEIRFPGKSLRFNNDFEFFQQEIAEQFPQQMDGFQKLLGIIQLTTKFSIPMTALPPKR